MRSVDPRAAEIMKTLAEFDASVDDAETALARRDWKRVETMLGTQHRLTHALANALDESRDDRPQTFTDEVNRRIQRISDRRADQLHRLIAFNHLVKARLTVISRAREMRRVHVVPDAPRILDLQQ